MSLFSGLFNILKVERQVNIIKVTVGAGNVNNAQGCIQNIGYSPLSETI